MAGVMGITAGVAVFQPALAEIHENGWFKSDAPADSDAATVETSKDQATAPVRHPQ